MRVCCLACTRWRTAHLVWVWVWVWVCGCARLRARARARALARRSASACVSACVRWLRASRASRACVPVCGGLKVKRHSEVLASHTRTVPSEEHEASRDPSFEKSMPLT
eukprot:4809364-Pleurochrysis_carterae.AAC.1